MFIIPNSNSEDNAPLLEFNHCHGPSDGKFCATPGADGGSGGTGGRPERRSAPRAPRPTPIRTANLDEAVSLILQGKVVELHNTAAVSTVLEKLAGMAVEAKKLGKDAPTYDLCNVTVPGTNLFCGSKLRSKKFPNGVPRIEMPQMGGEPVPGSAADKLPRKPGTNEVDGTDHFVGWLKDRGITTTNATIQAAKLKASQAELVGPKVAGMMASKDYDPGEKAIFTSRDNYVVDGHHRWAAVVGRDALDGTLGDHHPMKVIRIDAPISEVLGLANVWATEFGIAAKAAGKGAKVN